MKWHSTKLTEKSNFWIFVHISLLTEQNYPLLAIDRVPSIDEQLASPVNENDHANYNIHEHELVRNRNMKYATRHTS